jgi:predicted ATP-dependent protease
MRANREVSASDISVRTDPGLLDEQPREVADRVGMLPARGARALELGLSPRNPGFHVFVACEPEVRFEHDVVLAARKAAAALPPPSDVVFVHDFDLPEAPRPLVLPAGRGRDLAEALEQIVSNLEHRLGALGSTAEVREAQAALARELAAKNKQVVSDLESFAKSLGFGVKALPGGVQTFPILHGKPVSAEQFEVLDESTKRVLTESEGKLSSAVETAARRIREMTEQVNAASDDAMQGAAEQIVAQELAALRERFAELPEVISYVERVGRELVQDWPDFVQTEAEQGNEAEEQGDEGAEVEDPDIARRASRFRVNVYVAREPGAGAPVVYAGNPTFPNVFGYLERRARFGALVTDFTRIRAGDLSRASGGYLVLRAADLLTDPLIWERFKRVLRERRLAVEDPLGPLGTYSTTLRPRPVPLDVRVVLVGPQSLFEQLLHADPDFAMLFRVKVEVDWRVDRSEQNLRLLDGFLMSLETVRSSGAFDRGARAKLLDFATRLAGDKGQLALTPAPLEETACFAAICGLERFAEPERADGGAGGAAVCAADVERAWFERRERSGSIEREMRELALRGDLLVDVAGTRVGVVNGLSVLSAGDVEFGQPMRITAVVSLGREGLIDVEREAQLGGSIHTKGMAIVRGFLSHLFGQERPLSLRVQIAFEQSYGEVDGDSASAAELFAILSALADVGIDQGIAVTGSVNQLGDVQAIGGVCAKIEGFHDIACGRGLTGAQGVCLPRANLRHLVLRPDVAKAIADGRFHLYAVSSVAEGIEVLTGLPAGVRDASGRFPAGSVFGRVERRLIELAELLRSAEGGPGERAGVAETVETEVVEAEDNFRRR